MRRIGVYVCHCGSNIAGTVDVKDVAAAAAALPGVVVSRDYTYTCSDPGQEMIREDIRNLKLDRVVVAACSPRMHEPTFRETVRSAGLNPYYLQVANIREQVSWVTKDTAEATGKAKDLVRAAVARVALHRPLDTPSVPVNHTAVVVGGGIAGIQAALDIANAGHKVYLVERAPSIGGHMAQLDKTFPTLDCSACILTPRMVDVARHPNIEMLAYSEVVDVSGYVGNFAIKVRRRPRYVNEESCTGCGECAKACVLEGRIPDEFERGLSKRGAAYIPFPQAVPLKAVIDPVHCLYLTRGKCTRRCETACSRGAIDLAQSPREIEIAAGAVVLATGYELFDASRLTPFGYGRYPDVVDGLQFERLVNASGPTQGHIVTSEGKTPESVAFLHCIGSRDDNANKYCSRVCCMYSMKQAHLVRDKTGAEVFEFYIDIRASGKGYEEFYERIQGEGVNFVRGRAAEVVEENGRLHVRAEDTLLGRLVDVPADIVVLGSGLTPQPDAVPLARMFHVGIGSDGFFMEAHPKLRPVDTNTAGVFLAGACQGPKDIPESVAQASAAAAKVCALFSKDTIEGEPAVAEVDEALCTGCMWCEPVCPYGAVSPRTITERLHGIPVERRVAQVNPALCQGCGACSGACRDGAMSLKGCTTEQVLAEVDALCLGSR
ncbi:MAG: CoB--CoM heterodisulfide reductase iron-sulfur subunit A family protein [Firmicutes bacterium]|nr:CoB--CoM heterodisulfide reductase iron-sulfur subunit A family protein [Bacillota bacterium]